MSAAEILSVPQPAELPHFQKEFTDTIRRFSRPESLADAKVAMLALPGMRNYTEASGNDEEALSVATDDILTRMQSLAEISWVTYLNGMSAEQARARISDDRRKPYETLLDEPTDRNTLLSHYLTVGSYLAHRYAQEPTDEQARQNLKRFEEHSVHVIFRPLSDNLNDRIWGIDPDARQVGTITGPNEEASARIQAVAHATAQKHAVDPTSLENAIYAATAGGDLQLLTTYLLDYRGEAPLRDALEQIFTQTTSHPTYSREKVRLVLLVEQFKRKVGLSLNDAYRLNGFDATALEHAATAFLEQPQGVSEVIEHLRRETPDVLRSVLGQERAGQILAGEEPSPDDLKAIATINFFELINETNRRKDDVKDEIPSVDVITERNERLILQWQALSPLSTMPSEGFTLHVNARHGATRRAFNCSYDSGKKGEKHAVGDSMLNPFEGDARFWRVNAHEQTHADHNNILQLAERAGYIDKGSAGSLSSGVKEMLALLMDNAAQEYRKAQRGGNEESLTPINSPGLRYPDLKYALIHRFQAPYALTQLRVRQAVHAHLDQGHETLSDEMVDTIIEQTNKSAQEDGLKGVGVSSPRLTLLGNVAELMPYDGLTYIAGDLKPRKPGNESGIPPVRKALEARFGKDWLWNESAAQARAILYALYAETGKHTQGTENDFEALAEFVRSTSVEDAHTILDFIGIPREYR